MSIIGTTVTLWLKHRHGSVQFFVFTLLFFISLLISSPWCEQMWSIFRLCCFCLFSAIIYNLGVKVSDQEREGEGRGTVPCGGKALPSTCMREGGCQQRMYTILLTNSLWLWLVVFSWQRWILAIQITATGWSHRQWIFTQLTCIKVYCHIIMTI